MMILETPIHNGDGQQGVLCITRLATMAEAHLCCLLARSKMKRNNSRTIRLLDSHLPKRRERENGHQEIIIDKSTDMLNQVPIWPSCVENRHRPHARQQGGRR